MKKKRIDMSDSEYIVHLWSVNRPYTPQLECARIIANRVGTSSRRVKDIVIEAGEWY